MTRFKTFDDIVEAFKKAGYSEYKKLEYAVELNKTVELKDGTKSGVHVKVCREIKGEYPQNLIVKISLPWIKIEDKSKHEPEVGKIVTIDYENKDGGLVPISVDSFINKRRKLK